MTRSLRLRLDTAIDRGLAVLWNDGGKVTGQPLDISLTGMFLETQQRDLPLTASVLVTVSVPALFRSFTIDALIVRRNFDSRFPLGIALRWKRIPEVLTEFFKARKEARAEDTFVFTEAQRRMRFLLVDGDREFGQSMVEYAREHGIKLDAVTHLGVMPSLAAINTYDVLLVSYDLEPTSGLEIVEMLGRYLPKKPVVMLSMTGKPWQETCRALNNVAGVADKWSGPRHVLSRLFTAAVA